MSFKNIELYTSNRHEDIIKNTNEYSKELHNIDKELKYLEQRQITPDVVSSLIRFLPPCIWYINLPRSTTYFANEYYRQGENFNVDVNKNKWTPLKRDSDSGIYIIYIRDPQEGAMITHYSEYKSELEYLLPVGSTLLAVDSYITNEGYSCIVYEHYIASHIDKDCTGDFNHPYECLQGYDHKPLSELGHLVRNSFGRIPMMYALNNYLFTESKKVKEYLLPHMDRKIIMDISKNSYSKINSYILGEFKKISYGITKRICYNTTSDGDTLLTLALKQKNEELVKWLWDKSPHSTIDGYGRDIKFLIHIHLPNIASSLNVPFTKKEDIFGRTWEFYSNEPVDKSALNLVDKKGNNIILYQLKQNLCCVNEPYSGKYIVELARKYNRNIFEKKNDVGESVKSVIVSKEKWRLGSSTLDTQKIKKIWEELL